MLLKSFFCNLLVSLMFINCVNHDGIPRKLPELDDDAVEYDLSNALHVSLDQNNKIFVDSIKVTLEELKIKVRDYESKHKAEAIISYKAHDDVIYKSYVDVEKAITGEIDKLRKELAFEKYEKALDSLSKEQLGEIQKVYPKKLILDVGE